LLCTILISSDARTINQHSFEKKLSDARKVYNTAFWKPWLDYPLFVSQANNLRVMLLGMVDDPRVVLIKLADRLHNMRTMYVMSL